MREGSFAFVPGHLAGTLVLEREGEKKKERAGHCPPGNQGGGRWRWTGGGGVSGARKALGSGGGAGRERGSSSMTSYEVSRSRTKVH